MNAPVNRKELQRQYKETRRPAGVYRVRNTHDGRWLLGASVDVPAMLNRIRFQLEAGSSPFAALQRDWMALGPEAFAFETLDVLTPPVELAWDPKDDLRTLEAMWREKLRLSDGEGY